MVQKGDLLVRLDSQQEQAQLQAAEARQDLAKLSLKRQQDLLANPEVADKEAELREANASHFAAKRFADKRRRKARILRLRDELAALLKAELTLKPGDAERMTAWDPFDQNRHADFFDPEWMFGFQQGFDIVIGNWCAKWRPT